MTYNIKIGIEKSIKNTIVVLAPAVIAAWGAFVANTPGEYQPIIMAIGGFIGYFVKNWYTNKD